MKEKKVSLVTYVLSLIIMLVVVVSIMVAVFNQKEKSEQETKIQENYVAEHNDTQTKELSIINDVSYIGIQIEDESKEELAYTEPLIIKDETIVNNLKEFVNNGEEWTNVNKELGEGGFFEASPIVTFYLSNGNKVYLIARDNIKDNINIFALYYKEDASDKTIYKTKNNIEEYTLNLYKEKIATKLVEQPVTKSTTQSTTQSNTQANTKSVTQEEYFIIYQGREISKEPGVKQISDMETSEKNKKKYNIKYYNYENGQYKGETKGVFGKEETYEGQSIVSNVSKIAISKKYNAIPRKYRNWTQKEIETHQKIKNYEKIKIQEIDLDGDNKLEYIVNVQEDIKKGDLKDNSATIDANSYITIYDSNFNKKADLVKLENAFIDGEKKQENKVFLSIDDVEYIDIDNDGKMEILIELPSWEGVNYSLLKYDNGKIYGKVNYQVRLEP